MMERNLDEVIIYLKKKSERYRVLLASDDLVQQSYNTGFTKFQYEKYAEESEYLVDLLEELKAYRAIGTVEECRNSVLDILKAYNKAIDDFIKFANTMPTVEEDDGTIRPMWLEEIAEQLKVGTSNDKSI